MGFVEVRIFEHKTEVKVYAIRLMEKISRASGRA